MPNINELPAITTADGIIGNTNYFLSIQDRVATRVSTLAVEGLINAIAYSNFATASRQNAKSKPLSSTSTGHVGNIAFDNEYVYICVAENTWRRVPASTF